MSSSSPFHKVLNLEQLPPISDLKLSVFGVFGARLPVYFEELMYGESKHNSEEMPIFLSVNRKLVKFLPYNSA